MVMFATPWWANKTPASPDSEHSSQRHELPPAPVAAPAPVAPAPGPAGEPPRGPTSTAAPVNVTAINAMFGLDSGVWNQPNACVAAPAAPAMSPAPAAPVAAPAAAAPGAPAAPDTKAMLLDMQALWMSQILVATSSDIGSASSRQTFLTTLDSIDSPELRARVLDRFKAQTGEDVSSFVHGNDNFAKRDAGVVDDLISDKRGKAETDLAALPPAKLAEEQAKASEEAAEILKVTRADDSNDDENAQKIFRVLGPRTEMQMELIRRSMHMQTDGQESLYTELDKHLAKGNEDEAVQDMSGDKIKNTAVGLQNASGDTARLTELLKDAVKDGKLAEVKAQFNGDKKSVDDLIASVPDGAEREQVRALFNGDASAANAAELGNLLKDPRDGIKGIPNKQDLKNLEDRKPENVLKSFESKTPEEIKAARDQWNAQAKASGDGGTFEDMIKDRFGKDPETYARMQALLEGNVGKDKGIELHAALANKDQAKIEAALSDPDLASQNPEKRKAALERRAELDKEMKAEDQNIFTPLTPGRSTEEQVTRYYQDINNGPTDADELHALQKGGIGEMNRVSGLSDHAHDDQIGVVELMQSGKFSEATEIHRAKDKKDKKETAQLIDGIKSKQELEEARSDYEKKYGKPMIDDPMSTLNPMQKVVASQMSPEDRLAFERDHMNRNELLVENVKEFGVNGERDPEQQLKLQHQLYDLQSSDSLEWAEQMRGGGTQLWARQEMAATQRVLDGAERDANNKVKLDAEQKETVKQLDAGTHAALATQEEEKIKRGEHLAHVFGVIAKIGCILIAQPELVALADLATSLTEMAIKANVEGEAYDATDDAKMMAVTAVADAATMGMSKAGEAKNLAAARTLDTAGSEAHTAEEALKVAENTPVASAVQNVDAASTKSVEAATNDVKAAAEKVDPIAGDAAVLQKAESEAKTGGSAAAAETMSAEKKAAEEAEQKAAAEAKQKADEEAARHAEEVRREREIARLKDEAEAKKLEEGTAEHELEETKEASKTKAALTHEAITTVGGGIVNGEDPSTIAKNLLLSVVGEYVGKFDENFGKQLQEFLGKDSKMAKALGVGEQLLSKTTMSAAKGKTDAGDIIIDVAGDQVRGKVSSMQNAGKKNADQTMYTDSTVDAEGAEVKSKEEQEAEAKKREAAEFQELLEKFNEGGEGGGEGEPKRD